MGRRLSNTSFGFVLCSQGLCKALQELRAEMVATAEKNVIASAAQKEENLNVQILVDKQTKDLKVGFLPPSPPPHHHHHHQHTQISAVMRDSCVHEEPAIMLIVGLN